MVIRFQSVLAVMASRISRSCGGSDRTGERRTSSAAQRLLFPVMVSHWDPQNSLNWSPGLYTPPPFQFHAIKVKGRACSPNESFRALQHLCRFVMAAPPSEHVCPPPPQRGKLKHRAVRRSVCPLEEGK